MSLQFEREPSKGPSAGPVLGRGRESSPSGKPGVELGPSRCSRQLRPGFVVAGKSIVLSGQCHEASADEKHSRMLSPAATSLKFPKSGPSRGEGNPHQPHLCVSEEKRVQGEAEQGQEDRGRSRSITERYAQHSFMKLYTHVLYIRWPLF